MTLLKTTITAESNFATPLHGDTLFGQVCWMIRYRWGIERLEGLLEHYTTKPFLIVSDGFASGYLPKPTLPSRLTGEDVTEKKENRKRIWLTIEELQRGEFTKSRTDDEAENHTRSETLVKNSIDYKTFTTGTGFDPYSEKEYHFTRKDLYFLLDESRFTLAELDETLALLGEAGYGKNATIGKGRFRPSPLEEMDLSVRNTTTYMLLSPVNASGLEAKAFFYEPITKFGKHGGDLATQAPFKQPLLMAKSGSVAVLDTPRKIAYFGKAIVGHSVHRGTVHQGYAIALPIGEVRQ